MRLARCAAPTASCIFTVAAWAAGASAQTPALNFAPVAAPDQSAAVVLGSQGAGPEQWDRLDGELIVRNVKTTTLTPVLPEPAKATGAAVIVLPGGGFKMLSMQNEGWAVARWLADRGVAAFVLKYRVEPTPPSEAGFAAVMRAVMRGEVRDFPGAAAAADDAQAALRLVRSRAADWHVDPARVGFIGFSAGAMTALTATLRDAPDARPAFTGLIYGPMSGVQVPPDAPPLFAALAADDPLFGGKGSALIDAWQRAGKATEFHLFERGGHGFGMHRQGSSSDAWPELFLAWLRSHGLLSAPAPAPSTSGPRK